MFVKIYTCNPIYIFALYFTWSLPYATESTYDIYPLGIGLFLIYFEFIVYGVKWGPPIILKHEDVNGLEQVLEKTLSHQMDLTPLWESVGHKYCLGFYFFFLNFQLYSIEQCVLCFSRYRFHIPYIKYLRLEVFKF